MIIFWVVTHQLFNFYPARPETKKIIVYEENDDLSHNNQWKHHGLRIFFSQNWASTPRLLCRRTEACCSSTSSEPLKTSWSGYRCSSFTQWPWWLWGRPAPVCCSVCHIPLDAWYFPGEKLGNCGKMDRIHGRKVSRNCFFGIAMIWTMNFGCHGFERSKSWPCLDPDGLAEGSTLSDQNGRGWPETSGMNVNVIYHN